MKTLTAFLIALIVSFLSAFLFRKMALALGILDVPNHRKVHSEPIPLLGGLGIYLGVISAFLFFSNSFRSVLPIFIGGSIILYMGAYDDIKGLSAHLRFFIQLLAAGVVISMGIRVSFLPDTLLGNIAEVITTVIWIVGVTNAFNYLDGLDGLAAGSAVVNLLCFSIILYRSGQYPLGLAIFILMGACLGFIPHNFLGKKRMFLGDAGSMFLGFCLSAIAIMGDWAGDNVVKLSIPILILGVPIFDMIFTTIMRIAEGKVRNVIEWLQYGGKDHFHHYLVDLGLGQRQAVFFIYYLTFSLGLGAIMVSNDTALEGLLTVVQSSIVFGIIGVLIVLGKKRHQSLKHEDETEQVTSNQ
ncbi:MAG: undecaprenyl/decaprenyl-phosphate alpha-N-acetylglucosaminyl 1-phosphate transferase [Candidatus Omnitrophica bacterium]|nr:undecaprenyl/decaprenyl-phosphate alpha-N-acetylglucosaminyl 1-phosphate transferase [Candidatus Omnitrophota bacterium]